MIRRAGLWSGGLVLAVVLAGCGKITVRGDIDVRLGAAAGIDAVSLTMDRTGSTAGMASRVRFFTGRSEDEIASDPSLQLKVDTKGDPPQRAESYHFLSVITPAEDFGDSFQGGTAGERFVAQNFGRMIHLELRPGQPPQQAARSGRHHVGAALLAVVEDDDRVIPWQIDEGGEIPCEAPDGDGDCVDMRTITRRLFDRLAGDFQAGITESVPFATVERHALRFVPRVVHAGLEANGRRARGFGFIYTVEFSVPSTSYAVHVPINFLFVDEVTNYFLLIDPFDFSEVEDAETIARVFVKGTFVGGLAEGVVRNVILEELAAAELPEFYPGVAFGETVLYAFGFIAGAPPLSGSPSHVSTNYEAILLPEADSPDLDSNIVWQRTATGSPQLGQRVRLVFLE